MVDSALPRFRRTEEDAEEDRRNWCVTDKRTNSAAGSVLLIDLAKIDILQSTWEAPSLGAENEHPNEAERRLH